MSDPRGRPGTGTEQHGEFDREIDARSILLFGLGLAVVTGVVLAALWIALVRWKGAQAAHDAPPSPVAEANARRPPPEPRLQADPVRDMTALRAREASVLTTYGWIDRPAGVGRIPIDRAIDLLLAGGLPATPPAPAPSPPPKRPRRARRAS